MTSIFASKAVGGRKWSLDLALRLLGLASLLISVRLAYRARHIELAPPLHPAGLREFAICAIAFLLLASGLALLFEGEGLFAPVPLPPRSWVN